MAIADPSIQKNPIFPESPNLSTSEVLTLNKNQHDADSISAASDDLIDDEPEPFKLSNWFSRRHRSKDTYLDSISTRRSIFDDPDLAQHYWPKPDYENIHRFDPKARWTQREEKV